MSYAYVAGSTPALLDALHQRFTMPIWSHLNNYPIITRNNGGTLLSLIGPNFPGRGFELMAQRAAKNIVVTK